MWPWWGALDFVRRSLRPGAGPMPTAIRCSCRASCRGIARRAASCCACCMRSRKPANAYRCLQWRRNTDRGAAVSPTALAFVLAYVAGLGLAFVKHPKFGLYTYIAVFYIHPPSRWWGSFAPDMRWALIAGVVTLIASWRLKDDGRRPNWLSTTPARVLVLMMLWIWIQNLWALDPVEHLDLSVVFTKYVMLYYLIYLLLAY